MGVVVNDLPFPSRNRDDQQDYLGGQLLVAMPNMTDQRFERTVIYMCSHSEKGAMGLVLNKPASHITFTELLDQLEIEVPDPITIPVNIGGPVETGRGFVLHSSDYYMNDSTLKVSPGVGLTATLDVLRAIAGGRGPRQALLALGYAGWAPGQLEEEILRNGWLHCDADEALVFGSDQDHKWEQAVSKLGINPNLLVMEAGHA